jgi:hypothetical protein
MKNLIIVFFLLFSFSAFGQLQKSSGVLYFNNKTALDSWGAPATYGGELAVTLDTHLAYRWNGSIWVEIDTQLSEVEVDLYTANNGYLTFEQDSSVNNELQTLGFFGTTLLLSDGGGSVDLSSLQDGTGTDDQTASEVNITDSGGYYTGTEVETALSEIADTLGVHRTELGAVTALIPVITDETITGSTKTLDCDNKYSNVFDITNTGNYDCTLTINNELDNATYVFHIHGMSAEVDIIFPTDYKKADASTNLGTVTASSDIFVTCYDTGSKLNCSVVIDQ